MLSVARTKNPRRAKCLTGIYAINLKLKYGGCSLSSTMLIFQTGSKQAKNGTFFFPKRLKMALFNAFEAVEKAPQVAYVVEHFPGKKFTSITCSVSLTK